MKLGDVPCNGCTRCCHGDAIRILPHEDASQWLTEPHQSYRGHLMLAHKPDGDCVYLGPSGCTIHDSKPQQCKQFDCRVLAAKINFTQARKLDRKGRLRFAVWMRGRDLLAKMGRELLQEATHDSA